MMKDYAKFIGHTVLVPIKGTLFVLYMMLCYISYFHISGERTVQGIIGRNVSLSWPFNIKNDAVIIHHGTTPFVWAWPTKSVFRPYKSDERLRIIGETSIDNTVTVTINIINVTKDDAGIYQVKRQNNPEGFGDGVVLEIFDEMNIPKITMVQQSISDSSILLQCSSSSAFIENILWKLNGSLIDSHIKYSQNNSFLSFKNLTANDWYNVYTCEDLGTKLESNPYRLIMRTNHVTTITVTTWMDTELTDFPATNHYMYVVLGMGALLTVCVLTCLLHKFRPCSRRDRAQNSISFSRSNTKCKDENHEVQNPSSNYWTIVSDAKGELSTAMETKNQQLRYPKPDLKRNFLKQNTPEQSINVIAVNVCMEFAEYMEPLQSHSLEHVDYIHPVHTGPVNADVLQKHHTL